MEKVSKLKRLGSTVDNCTREKRVRSPPVLYAAPLPKTEPKKPGARRSLSVVEKTKISASNQKVVPSNNCASKNDEPETFGVEAILDHRIHHGGAQFLIKWEGYAENYNSWEPITNLTRATVDLVEDFQARACERLEWTSRKRRGGAGDSGAKEGVSNKKEAEKLGFQKPERSPKSIHVSSGFDDSSQEFEKIRGVTVIGDEIVFGIKWKGVEELEFIPGRTVNQRIPEEVIAFYESKLILK